MFWWVEQDACKEGEFRVVGTLRGTPEKEDLCWRESVTPHRYGHKYSRTKGVQ